MDLISTSAESKINCWNDWEQFNRSSGSALSAYEHLVPEQIFSTEATPVEGVSAIKAIAIASAQGQRIYTITPGNLNSALAAIDVGAQVEQEIQHSVTLGMEVTVSQNTITHAGV